VIAWLRHHRASFAQTLARLARSPAATLLNVLVIGIALALPLGGYCVLVGVQALAGQVSTEPQISVFLAADASRRDISGIEERIRAARGVKALRFVSRESALAELKRDPAVAELAATLRDNPLPDAFVVDVADRDSATVEQLQRDFLALPKVSHVQADSAWIQRLDALLRLGRTAVVLLAALLGVALVAVTFNTIRLQIVTQREEIEVSRLLGATDAFIRRPFYYYGLLQGLFGGLMALALVYGALGLLNREVAALAQSYGSGFRLAVPGLADAAALLAFGALLGALGAHLSVDRQLRLM
jgi:cell division transport system permease protein